MRNLLNFILLVIVVSSLFAYSIHAESTYNFLTKGLADTLYCRIDGSNCAGGSGGLHAYSFPTQFVGGHDIGFNITEADVYEYEIPHSG